MPMAPDIPASSSPAASPDTSVTFGLETVRPEERQARVNEVFSTVAERYDLMNDVMSGGLHRAWKSDFVTMLNPPKAATPFRLLDVAGGTGDIAMRAVERGGAGCEAVICDISPEMLAVGQRRVDKAGLSDRITLVEGNAEVLPFPESSFDAYTIAFGIRNVTHIERALAEAYRVLRRGSRFLCLEFSEVQTPVIDRLYDFHSFEVIPRAGKAITGSEESYRYLVESIRRFPKQEAFATMIREAGFERVTYKNHAFGVAAVHTGWRL
jgi:demethylmenaquinone methyltransferase / 2-methoxy-6-polyprenyl-1,4-benzoquinol methylase